MGDRREGAVLVTEKEMAITHADFFRILSVAFETGTMCRDGDRIVIEDGEKSLRITLSAEAERRIALLRLPVTRVRLEFVGYQAGQAEAALARFDRAFQRGGG